MKAKCNGCGKTISFTENRRVTLECPACGGSVMTFLEKEPVYLTCGKCGERETIQPGITRAMVHKKVGCNSKVFIPILARADTPKPKNVTSQKATPPASVIPIEGYFERKNFADNGGIKVAWVQDLEKMGGAELSNKTCVEIGEKLGFDIVGITPIHFKGDALKKADILIINNFFKFSHDQWLVVTDAIRTHGKKYIKYEHDYREVDIRRRYDAWRMFHRAERCIFISPMHLKDHLEVFGLKRVEDGGTAIALPLAVDTETFKPIEGVERRENAWINTSGQFAGKCTHEYLGFINSHPDHVFEVIAEGDRNFDSRIKAIDRLTQEELPAYYSSADGLFHFPDCDKWAGERIVFEAALCGVKKFALNDNVGHKSWGKAHFDDISRLRDWLRQSIFDFWKIVERTADG